MRDCCWLERATGGGDGIQGRAGSPEDYCQGLVPPN